MESDFNRALESWDTFKEWRFVTNAPAGPECGRFLVDVQLTYGPGAQRVVAARFWDGDRLWTEVVGSLAPSKLNDLFPGAPGIENVELSDLIPLLDVLGVDSDATEVESSINPVPVAKMDYNRLPPANRLEFNSGRTMASRIDRWFAEQAGPDLRDHQGRNFRKIYERHRLSTIEPGEIIERMYASIGGPNIRFDGRRANAVYAITAYFFDSCHIFEEPPPDFGVVA
ncbi:ABC-three component system protein [Arthrobacter sp. NicSoilB4]|uniref:ABC-three component system protein n=1 Tax=Arthrobacter sp. NicSoilB4 TaxID=2830997 RepID=UPI001CC4C266|nr:ABC-three component system protein [Arthrobacter sp. NicSoilB4]